jgi:hypothetical protein
MENATLSVVVASQLAGYSDSCCESEAKGETPERQRQQFS